MNYCVLKDTKTGYIFMSLSDSEDTETMRQNGINAGLYEPHVEIIVLTEEEYQAMVELEPKPPQLPTDIELLQKENLLLKAQVQANADISDFHEELIVELAMMLYQ